MVAGGRLSLESSLYCGTWPSSTATSTSKLAEDAEMPSRGVLGRSVACLPGLWAALSRKERVAGDSVQAIYSEPVALSTPANAPLRAFSHARDSGCCRVFGKLRAAHTYRAIKTHMWQASYGEEQLALAAPHPARTPLFGRKHVLEGQA